VLKPHLLHSLAVFCTGKNVQGNKQTSANEGKVSGPRRVPKFGHRAKETDENGENDEKEDDAEASIGGGGWYRGCG